LCDRLVEHGGPALALSSTAAPPQSLRVNTLKTTRAALLATLQREGIVARASAVSPVGVVVVERSNVFRTAAFREGLFEVQDEGSQLIALLAGARPGMRVVDGCAGAGGKTLALAAPMETKGTLVALDVHGGRLQALRERAARAGVHNVRVHDLDEEKKARKRLKGQCDVVVVDAPCSGSGVLRRNPDTGWRLGAGDVARLQSLQRELLAAHAPLVKPGGVLVYATCSLLDDETGAVVAGFLGGAPSFSLAPARQRLADAGVDVDVGDVLALDPVRHGTDGFFAAVLARHA
jgi:16S rRNA (cytosine967-C5)-methyltransferase